MIYMDPCLSGFPQTLTGASLRANYDVDAPGKQWKSSGGHAVVVGARGEFFCG